MEDWHRIFVGFQFLRNFSYSTLWNIGKERKVSYGMLSYNPISQENYQEVRPLGKIPGGRNKCACSPARSFLRVMLGLHAWLCFLSGRATKRGKKRPYPSWLLLHAGLLGSSILPYEGPNMIYLLL
uniref:Uncharacterized protein n=1 Tax=Arundo donax TaxID=35708 RepID=A0A0A8ZGM6_ARUDO